MDLPLWIRHKVTWVFCQSWLLRGQVWGQGLAEAWDLTIPLCPLSPCSSHPLAIPGALGQPTEGALRPMFLLLYQAPASPGESALPAFQDHVQGGAGVGTLEKPDGSAPTLTSFPVLSLTR